METKSKLLIIADDDLSYGIEKGYYPDLSNAISLDNISVFSLGDVEALGNKDIYLSARPIGDGEDIYVRNPYANCYIPIKDTDLLNTFVQDKSHAIKEVLVKMGAKDIVMTESVHDNDSHRYDGNNNMGMKKMAKAEINGRFVNDISIDMKSCIESHDPNRKPKSYEEVIEFMKTHGLASDAKLNILCERLKSDGKISGIEKYEVTYCSEITSALTIAASIDYKMFSDNLNFSREHNHVHTISKILEINFG
jgi:hypothetical protein